MAETGPENWVIDGTAYHVNRTYYVRQGIHEVVYVIEHPVSDKSMLFGMSDEKALSVAFPMIAYAYQSHAYERTRFKALRGTETARVLIGVDLVADGHTYRVIQSMGEIVLRLKGQPGQ